MELEKVSKLYEVIWIDPRESEGNLNEIEAIISAPDFDPKKFLIETHSFGNMIYQDEAIMMLGHYIDGNSNVGFEVINKSIIQDVIPYSRNDNIDLKDYWRNKKVPKRRRLVEIDWVTSNKIKTDVEHLARTNSGLLEDHLNLIKSYGVIATEDCSAVILKHCQNDLDMRRVHAIPRELIKGITPFYSKRD
jgi:hypothetical protein